MTPTDTTITLTLTALGPRLFLVQSGYGPYRTRESGGAHYGWKTMGGTLVDLLARIP